MKNKHVWLIIASIMVALMVIVGLIMHGKHVGPILDSKHKSHYMTKPEFMDKFHVIQKEWNGIIPVDLFYKTMGQPDSIRPLHVDHYWDYELKYNIKNGDVKLFATDVGERLIAPSKYEDCFSIRAQDDISKQRERLSKPMYMCAPDAGIPPWPPLTEEQRKQRLKEIVAENKAKKKKFEEYLKQKYGY